jgi:16S rRNA processing protein RimM
LSDLVEIGRLVKIHGLKGRLKAVSYLESENLLCEGELDEVIIRPARGPGGTFKVRSVKPQHNSFFIELEGINDPDSAGRLVGSGIFIPADMLEELPEDEYYWHEIIGLKAITESGDCLGAVSSIFPAGGSDVYVVTGGTREILLPAIADVIRKIDLEKGEITVRIPEGL